MILYDCKKVFQSPDVLETDSDTYFVSLYVLNNGPDKDVKFSVLTSTGSTDLLQKVGDHSYAYKGRDGNYYLETRFSKFS